MGGREAEEIQKAELCDDHVMTVERLTEPSPTLIALSQATAPSFSAPPLIYPPKVKSSLFCRQAGYDKDASPTLTLLDMSWPGSSTVPTLACTKALTQAWVAT